jgi:hypothetical protein
MPAPNQKESVRIAPKSDEMGTRRVVQLRAAAVCGDRHCERLPSRWAEISGTFTRYRPPEARRLDTVRPRGEKPPEYPSAMSKYRVSTVPVQHQGAADCSISGPVA